MAGVISRQVWLMAVIKRGDLAGGSPELRLPRHGTSNSPQWSFG